MSVCLCASTFNWWLFTGPITRYLAGACPLDEWEGPPTYILPTHPITTPPALAHTLALHTFTTHTPHFWFIPAQFSLHILPTAPTFVDVWDPVGRWAQQAHIPRPSHYTRPTPPLHAHRPAHTHLPACIAPYPCATFPVGFPTLFPPWFPARWPYP